MTENVFQFGNKYYCQLNSTAMGTSCACKYATIYYSYHEETQLLTKKKISEYGLIFYRRLIDDALIIQESNYKKISAFTTAMNNYGPLNQRLEWTATTPNRSDHFLDLFIHIKYGKPIETSTFQKPMNLFLYRPPCSAQPERTTDGLIYGTLYCYFWQNIKLKEFITYVKKKL